MASNEKDMTAQLAERLNAAAADLTPGTITQGGNIGNGGTLNLGTTKSYAASTTVSSGNLNINSFAGLNGASPVYIAAGAQVTVPSTAGDVTVTGPLATTVDELRTTGGARAAVKK